MGDYVKVSHCQNPMPRGRSNRADIPVLLFDLDVHKAFKNGASIVPSGCTNFEQRTKKKIRRVDSSLAFSPQDSNQLPTALLGRPARYMSYCTRPFSKLREQDPPKWPSIPYASARAVKPAIVRPKSTRRRRPSVRCCLTAN